MLLPAFIAFAALFAPPASAACPADAQALVDHANRAVDLYQAFEFEPFQAMASLVHEEVLCLGEIVEPEQAATVHVVHALDAWLEKNHAEVLTAFRGALAAQPGFELDPKIAAEGSRLRALFVSAQAIGPGGSQSVSAPLVVDGHTEQMEVPTERAALVQLGSASDLQTWYLTNEAILADVLAATSVSPTTGSTTKGASPQTSRTLLLSGAVAAALGTGGLIVSSQAKNAYYAEPDSALRDELLSRNKTMGISGYALVSAGGGLVAVGLLKKQW